MNNYQLMIQYDGGRYKGWQRLGNEQQTIQGKIENVLSELVGKKIEIIGCSRTDAGVHALTQVANFKTKENLTEEEIKKYLNYYLPQDICIKSVRLVDENFHARYNAKDKTYLYKIWNHQEGNPFIRKYCTHVRETLDIEKMKKAGQFFIGQHDFTAFSNAKSKKKSMVREIYRIDIGTNDGLIEIRVQGNGFLHNMVRKMVGILIEVGLGEVEAEGIPKIIQLKQRKEVGRIAEACGLYLEKITF
jgi:tRNA pseudouridine38-40 synthase